MSSEKHSFVAKAPAPNGKDWHAWLNTMPGGPHTLHVSGALQVGNPGIYAVLQKKVPQGINPAYDFLELHLIQRPGIWPQHVVWTLVSYTEVIHGANVQEVEIFFNGNSYLKLPVEIVS